jgi:hypothetical protein
LRSARVAFAAHWRMLGTFDEGDYEWGRDMEEIIAENKPAYEIAYKAMYPKEHKDHCWNEIEAEWRRVRLLNSIKPDGAEDIQTYGSRIGAAVLKSVNPVARFFKLKREEGGAD